MRSRAGGVSCSLQYPWLHSQAPAHALLIYLHREVEEVWGGYSNRIHLVHLEPRINTHSSCSGSGVRGPPRWLLAGLRSSWPRQGRGAGV